MKKLNDSLVEEIRLTLQWIKDVDEGEMIETRSYTRKFLYLGLNWRDTEIVARAVNHVLLTLSANQIVQAIGTKIYPFPG